MAVVCGMIIVRTVRRDLTRYEELFMDGSATESELKEDAGWKLVSGDVFRAPTDVQSLAVRVGSGLQILATLVVTMFFSAVGFLSPASRGSLLTALLVLYLLLAVAAGFGGVWLWSTASRSNQGWRRLCWKISLYFPGITFFIFTIVNMAIHHTGSTGQSTLCCDLHCLYNIVHLLLSLKHLGVGHIIRKSWQKHTFFSCLVFCDSNLQILLRFHSILWLLKGPPIKMLVRNMLTGNTCFLYTTIGQSHMVLSYEVRAYGDTLVHIGLIFCYNIWQIFYLQLNGNT